jgi:hypothetical protein
MMYLDSICLHNSRKSPEYFEKFRTRRVPHSDDDPDLTSSEFFLFGHIKSKLLNFAIRSREDLIYEIRRIFEEIPKATLISVYISRTNELSRRLRIAGTISIDEQKTISLYLEVS